MNRDASWFRTVASTTVHEGHVTLRVDTVQMPDGEADREVAIPPDAVGVVARIDDDADAPGGGDIVLVRQYRQPLGRTTLELPAGVRDVAGEDPLDTGRRELAEECGLRSDDWSVVTTIRTSPGWSTEAVTLLLARDCRPGEPPEDYTAHHEESRMEVVRLPVEAAIGAVRDGTIQDAKTIVGLLLLDGAQPA